MIGDRSKTGQLVGVGLLGIVLLDYPILTLFNLNISLFGIPFFYLYLFTVWSGMILLMMLLTRKRPTPPSRQPQDRRDAADSSHGGR
jgi:hypothetical protein